MRLRQTHTYVTLDVPQEFYDYVAERLRQAGYDHAFHQQSDGQVAIDMHGIALVPQADTSPNREAP